MARDLDTRQFHDLVARFYRDVDFDLRPGYDGPVPGTNQRVHELWRQPATDPVAAR